MAQRKNILFITCDQLRADTLGFSGDPVIHTPNIDSLAARGLNFKKMFTAYPVCAPNRATLATGRYPSVHGLRWNGMVLPEQEVTMMEVLRQSGYATAGVGKMHFGPQWKFGDDPRFLRDPGPEMAIDPQPTPEELPWYGFEEAWITEDNRVGPYGDYLKKQGYDVWDDPHSFSYPQHQTVRSTYPVEHHQTTWIADRSIDFLQKQTADKPFFLWTSFVAPHHPFVVPAPYDTMYDPKDMPQSRFVEGEPENWPEDYYNKYIRTEGSHEAIGMSRLSDEDWQRVRAYYYGSITHIDDQIGRIFQTLGKNGILENTVIVFTSDHGEMLGDHHLVFKGTTFDEVTRVPFLVVDPGRDAATRDGLCCSIDVMPTLLDLVGAEVPACVQGKSLADPQQKLRDEVLIETVSGKRALRTEHALLSWHGSGRRGELYDLRSDPGAVNNLWDLPEHADLQRQLTDRLIQQMAWNTDPLPVRSGFC